uniref:MIT_C domain-containing protein n=1 Tax=Parastrongyloides trichosuri TaxID=131310 RepID=A0A0N4ZVK7_PARTI
MEDFENVSIFDETALKESFVCLCERFYIAREYDSKLQVKICKEIQKKLKKLFNMCDHFPSLKNSIENFDREYIIPLFKKIIITDIEDENFNFYPDSSDDEKDENKDKFINIDRNNSCTKKSTNELNKRNSKDFELIEFLEIYDNQIGVTFQSIFTKERIGHHVSSLNIQDPYLCTQNQITLLFKFIQVIKRLYPELRKIDVQTQVPGGRTIIYKDLQKKHPESCHQSLLAKEMEVIMKNLNDCRDACKKYFDIAFDYQFVIRMHDRHIEFDNHTIAILGRGLDIFCLKRHERKPNWEQLRCRGCKIHFLRRIQKSL